MRTLALALTLALAVLRAATLRFTLVHCRCASEAELHVVRDGFYLGLARTLGMREYKSVEKTIIEDERVGATAETEQGFQTMVEVARTADGWDRMIQRLLDFGESIGSDLPAIWGGLEQGRLQWLAALTAAHSLKSTLKTALAADAEATAGDISDSKMVWMYGLATVLPQCKELAEGWALAAEIEQPANPLKGYKEALWDPRREEWAGIDYGVQAAAEAGGTSLDESWEV